MAPFANSDPEAPSARRQHGRRRQSGAFSLVEVALALGIIAFALIPVIGLLPIGLSSYRKSIDLSVGSQITQRIIDEAQQSDFDTLTGNRADPFAGPVRYFGSQGEELNDKGELLGGPTDGQQQVKTKQSIIYRVNTRIAPSTLMPGSADADGGVKNLDIATVTVQVANNPSNRSVSSDVGNLWISTQSLPLTSSSTYVARNSAPPQ